MSVTQYENSPFQAKGFPRVPKIAQGRQGQRYGHGSQIPSLHEVTKAKAMHAVPSSSICLSSSSQELRSAFWSQTNLVPKLYITQDLVYLGTLGLDNIDPEAFFPFTKPLTSY